MNQDQVRWVMPDRMIGSDEGYPIKDLRDVGCVPVVPLDALEAWLNEAWAMGYKAPMGHLGVIQYLLAQVREWKEDAQ